MNDDPTIAARREARHKISASVNHDLRKLVAHYRELQERHRERLVSRQTAEAERQDEPVPNVKQSSPQAVQEEGREEHC
jgi:hypothetical protein